MNISANRDILLCFLTILQSVTPVPIIPFKIVFGKVSRPQTLNDDTTASIGPGLGGSPILVDTRHQANPK